MNEQTAKKPLPVLDYTQAQYRRPNLLLANLFAVSGMFMGVAGFPFVVGGLLALALGIFAGEWLEVWPALIATILGLGMWFLAWQLCRRVYGIANGVPHNR